MPALPIIEDVMRVTFNFTGPAGSLLYHNVLHFENAPPDNEDALVDNLTNALDANFEEMFCSVSVDYGVSDIDLLPLDGVSSTTNFLIGNHGGQSTGNPIPNTAQIVSFYTGERGRSRRGRIFLGPCAEGTIANGRIGDGCVSDTVAGWTAFVDAMDGFNQRLVVASYKLEDTRPVRTVVAPHVAGTQRRRQERLGRL